MKNLSKHLKNNLSLSNWLKKSYLPRAYRNKSTLPGSKTTAGFTMVEMAIVVLVIGILSAIAAPSWLAFVNRQRTRTFNGAVFRALKSAQTEAKAKQLKRRVEFRYDPTATSPVDPPEIDIRDPDADPNWKSLNFNGEIKEGAIALFVGVCADALPSSPDDPLYYKCAVYDWQDDSDKYPIVFDNTGALADQDENTWLDGKKLSYIVTVSTADKKLKRCIIVQTLLGTMRTDEGDYDTTNNTGCPVP